MKSYQRVLAFAILLCVLMTGISDCVDIRGGLPFATNVMASERFTWGSGSLDSANEQDDSEQQQNFDSEPKTEEDQNLTDEAGQENERFAWNSGDDPVEESGDETPSADENGRETFNWNATSEQDDLTADDSLSDEVESLVGAGNDSSATDKKGIDGIGPALKSRDVVNATGLPPGVTGLVQTLDTSAIMNINLFDYEAYDGGRYERHQEWQDGRLVWVDYVWNSAGIDHEENFNPNLDPNHTTTINVDSEGRRRQFRFFPSGTMVGNGTYTINNYSGGHDTYDSSAVQGIVSDMTVDGYPVLKNGYTDNTSGVQVNTDKSLAYLFDPTISDSAVPGRISYTGLNHLFYLDDDGYYTFDSAQNYAFIDTVNGSKDFALYNLGKDNNNNDLKYPGFYPLTDYEKSWNGLSTSQQHTTKYNHHFSLTMSAEFMIPENGLINGKEEIFRFSGDDDVWVFVDGKLVLDLGGIHQPIGASINFATGKVTYETGIGSNAGGTKKNCNTVQVGQYDNQKIGPRSEIQTNLKSIIDNNTPDTVHTIQFFMCERGGCDSNCLLQFNLVMLENLHVGKKVTGLKQNEDPDKLFGFIIYLENKDGVYEPITADTVNNNDTMLKLKKVVPSVYQNDEEKTKVPFDAENNAIFYLKDGEEARLSGIERGRHYYVQEVNVDTTRYDVYLDHNSDELPVSGGIAESPEYKVTDKAKITFKNEVKPNKDLHVKKIWKDENGNEENDEHIGTSVTMHLLADGHEISSVVLDGIEDENEIVKWEHTFSNLPVEAEDGHAIVYAIREDAIDGYYTLYDTENQISQVVDDGNTYWEEADGMEEPSMFPHGDYIVVAESMNADRALTTGRDLNTDGVAMLSRPLERVDGVLEDEEGIIHNDYIVIPSSEIANYRWNVGVNGDGYSLKKGNQWLGYETAYYSYNQQQMVSRLSFTLKNSEPSAPILSKDKYVYGDRISEGRTITDYVYNNSGAVEVTQSQTLATKFTLYKRISMPKTMTTTVETISNRKIISIPDGDGPFAKYRVPISKTIDAMRDGDDNPDTLYEDEMADEEKKDLYRLYLDIGPVENTKTYVILVMDYSRSMYPIVREDTPGAVKIGNNYFEKSYLMMDKYGNYQTRYDAVLDAMTEKNSLVDMILPDTDTENRMCLIGFSYKDKDDCQTSRIVDWTNNSDAIEDALKTTYPTTGETNYEAALNEARAAIESAPDDAQTYLVFVSDGIPTAYLDGNGNDTGRIFRLPGSSDNENGCGTETVQNLVGDMNSANTGFSPDHVNGVIYHTQNAIGDFNTYAQSKGVQIVSVALSNKDMHENINATNLNKWDNERYKYDTFTINDFRYDTCLETLAANGTFCSADSAVSFAEQISEAIPILRVQGPVIRDQLTDYVQIEGENNGDLKLVMKSPDPTDSTKMIETVLWKDGGPTSANIQADGQTPIVDNITVSNTGEVVVAFNPDYVMSDRNKYTVSMNVKATQTAFNTYVENLEASKDGYDNVKGDENTDFNYVNDKGEEVKNDTSSEHSGFHSNVSADATYKVNGNQYRLNYKHPVVQVDTSVDVTLIKTSSVMLPQPDESMAYEILPNVEFTLYERTIEKEIVDGQERDKEVLTPIIEKIVSDDGTNVEELPDNATEEQIAAAVAAAAANKGKVFLKKLERGKTYVLKETNAAEGYYLPGSDWIITIGIDGTVTISGQNNYASTDTVPEEGEFAGCYQITNVKMYELPSTGGPGDYMFTIIGIAISVAVVLQKLREKQEERAA